MAQLDNRFIGSISEGTMRTQDLLPRFISVLAQADPQHDAVLDYKHIWDAATVLAEWMGRDYAGNAEDVLEAIGFWDSEQASYLLNEDVFNALNEVAPAGTYFGSSEGDGASYGFWYAPCSDCGRDEGHSPDCPQSDEPIAELEDEEPYVEEPFVPETLLVMADQPEYFDVQLRAKAGETVSASRLLYQGVSIDRPCVNCDTVDVHFQGHCNGGICQHPDCAGMRYTSQYNHYLHTPSDHAWQPGTYVPALITVHSIAFDAMIAEVRQSGLPNAFTSDLFRDWQLLTNSGIYHTDLDERIERFIWAVRDTGTDLITERTEPGTMSIYLERADALYVWDQTYLPGIGLARIQSRDARDLFNQWRRAAIAASQG